MNQIMNQEQNFSTLSDIESEDGNLEEDEDIEAFPASSTTQLSEGSCIKKRKRRQFVSLEEDENNPLPPKMKHIRISENKVRDEHRY